MKKFITKCFLFSFFLFVVLISFFACFFFYRNHADCQKFTPPLGETVFITGDSHAGCSFAQTDKHKPYLLWCGSSDFTTTYMRILKLEELGSIKDLKTIVIPIAIHSVFCFGAEKRLCFDEQIISSLSWSWSFIFNVVSHRQIINAILNRPLSSVLGISADNEPAMRSRRLLDKPVEVREKIISDFTKVFNPDSGSLLLTNSVMNDLSLIQGLCKKHNIRLVLFSAPLFSDYTNAIHPDSKTTFQHFLEDLQGKGFEYHDYRNRITNEYFHDPYHLNAEGAKKFTDLFYDEVLNISR